ncbi:GTP cyclohydrolase I FolE2 [bacterium]|jgi:GTP cyclohydrolase I|nr:GTP cyclohydrolase I FolE2 [bacterium]NBW57746.1 GTP cyclohydrolase I FolE2 [bacterium]NBX71927.1 GTP cyclohydrolase I FolE2 [bacterium]
MTTHQLADIQNALDTRNLPIQNVGVKQLQYPIVFKDQKITHQTHGIFDLTVNLPAEQKGAHLSRFTSLLQSYYERDALVMSIELMPVWHKRMINLLNAKEGSFSCSFKFFLEKKAPVSQETSLLDYHLTLSCAGPLNDPAVSIELEVLTQSLCPCSKAISAYGAHNQRSVITVSGRVSEDFNIKQLIELIEHEGSAELFNLLKRVDEKYVTEHAYENPKFSEDIVRDVYHSLKKNIPSLSKLVVSSEHIESIHSHNAYARIHDNP